MDWYSELCDRSKAQGIAQAAKPIKVARPAVFAKAEKKPAKSQKTQETHLKVKRAWELALAPAKSLPMNLFMSWMSGNSLEMVTITMTAYMFFLSPLSQIFGVQQTFKALETKETKSDIFWTKLVYIGCALLTMAAGVWKVGRMGLLPTHSSDWLSWEEPTQYLQVAHRLGSWK